ncbi:hypothetical protein WJX72_000404 [[Myrmecia] bisecta]|uniref:peptidylprolyl isomerase n=1 Tax=[Myrmecia] bisecta TaxID=41462 RepID=A0AAW1QNM4_9CHLO
MATLAGSCAVTLPIQVHLCGHKGHSLHGRSRVIVAPSCQASRTACATESTTSGRRHLLQTAAGLVAGWALPRGEAAQAGNGNAGTPEDSKLLCEAECQASLDRLQTVTTASGLKYVDIKVGSGPSPPTGFQVVANYVAMTPNGRVFDSSLDKGSPYDIRIGAGQVIPGLDEGVATMKVGGLRRLYIPGPLSFPKGLPAGPGRPRVPPASPVIFDVQLLYIPGLDLDDE